MRFFDLLAEQLRDHGTSPRPSMFITPPRAEVEQFFAQAGGAACVDAAPVDFAFFAHQGALADGAVRGKDDVFGVLGRCGDAGDFGNDVAAAFDRDVVADADAEPGDLVGLWSVARLTVVPPM